MPGVNPWAVIVATVASFLAAGGWYALMGSRPGGQHKVSVLVSWTGTRGILPLLGLSALLFVAFPAVLLAGSVWHEKVPPALTAIHAVDWLLKLVLTTLVTGLWR